MKVRTAVAALGLLFAIACVAHASTATFGYGLVAGPAAEKALPAGSFYTEPGDVAHFAETKADPVLVYISGDGLESGRQAGREIADETKAVNKQGG